MKVKTIMRLIRLIPVFGIFSSKSLKSGIKVQPAHWVHIKLMQQGMLTICEYIKIMYYMPTNIKSTDTTVYGQTLKRHFEAMQTDRYVSFDSLQSGLTFIFF